MLISSMLKKPAPQFVSGTEDDLTDRFGEIVEMEASPGEGWPSQKDREKALRQRRLWTMVSGDDDTLYFVSGHHLVNRLGYWITEKPYPQGFEGEYRIDSPDDEDFDRDGDEEGEE